MAIKGVVTTMMNRAMNNVLHKDPFITEKHHSAKPLYAAWVPDEIFKMAHFERGFVTPFGSVWKKLVQVVAAKAHGHCLLGHNIDGVIGDERLRRLQELLNNLETKAIGKERTQPDWLKELEFIQKGGGNPIPVRVNVISSFTIK